MTFGQANPAQLFPELLRLITVSYEYPYGYIIS
jgi:hypothetical protein